MKQRVFFIVLLFLFLSRLIPQAQAACIIGGGKSVSASVSFQSFGDEGSNLSVNGKSFFRNKPQCTSPKPSRSYTISCDEETETLAADSLFAPLCGASEERGKTNSTCWQCGGTVKCDGLDWAVGATDPFFSQIHNPVSPGDTNMDQVWRIPNGNIPNDGFTYNGQHYDKPGGDLIACGSNNLACGSSEECTNIKHPDVNNRGRSGQQQCTAYSYMRLSLTPGSTSGVSDTVKAGGDKACINIGDYSSHFNELSRAADTFPNGWIYILALPEWMDSISKFIGEHPSNNFMIRLHHPNAELSPDYANRWVANLKIYAGNITNKVYLMPVNEPNNIDPNRHVDVDVARVFISALSQGLDNEGLLNTKYIVTSPMIDPTSADVTGYLDNFCADEFCDQFAAVAAAPYDFTGDMADIKAYFPSDAHMIVAETGIKRDGQVVYGRDSETADFLNSVKDSWGKSAIAACIFSYDPDRNTNQEWIYSAPLTQQALRSLGQSINPISAPQVIQPKTKRSTISYESCTEAGTPDITTKVAIPNLAKFGEVGTDKKGNRFLSALWELSKRPVKGILGFQGSKAGKPIVDGPSVYKSLGMQLDRALPFLTPLAINVQPIIQEYSHTATSTLCYDNDEQGGAIQAFPIKERIIIPAPGLNKLRQNGRILAGFVAPNVSISKGEYEHLGELNPATLGSIRFNPTCDEPPSARIVRKTVVPTTEAEYYDLEAQGINPIYKLSNWINRALSIVGLKCSETNCNDLQINKKMDAHIKIKTPKIREIMRDTTNDPSGKPVGALATFVPGSFSFPNEHGKVSGQIIEQEVGSNSKDIEPVDVNYFGAYTMDVYNRFTNCAIHPQSLQKNLDYSCNFSENATGVPNTSDWAGTTGTRNGPPEFTPSGPFYELLVQKAEKYDVPQCVMEGVGRIEGGGRYSEILNLNDCFKTTNTCSAVGPMQFTIGPGHGKATEEACKNSCGAGYCPNAWSTWGNGGNPCRYEDALDAAARYLAAFGNFSSGDQKQSIHDATTAYYGSDNDETARNYLKGCEYWEFVYKQCNPEYICQQQRAQ